MTPLLDWQQWVLALVTGLVSAATYEGISQFRRARYWRPVRESLIKESWHEAVWVWVVLTNFKGWRVPMPADVDDRSLFEGHVSELREIRNVGDPTSDSVDIGRLTSRQKDIVNLLPELRPFAADLARFLDDVVARYPQVWTPADQKLLLDTRRPLAIVADWRVPNTKSTDQAGVEIFRGVDYAETALVAIGAFGRWAQQNHPRLPKMAPLQNSTIDGL